MAAQSPPGKTPPKASQLSPPSSPTSALARGACSSDDPDEDRMTGSTPATPPSGRPKHVPMWVRTISDSILVVRGGGRVPATPVLRTMSLPARPGHNEPEEGRQKQTGRRLTMSQAALIIPRSVSEYFECCRYSRVQSGGLLLDRMEPSGAFAERHVRPQAFSEGLLAGRLFSLLPSVLAQQQQQNEASGADKPKPPRPVSELQVGECLEGVITRVDGDDLFIDVGATKVGCLKRQSCKGVPERLLQRGATLSNLVIVRVNVAQECFFLGLRGVDGSSIEQQYYPVVLQHIGDWANVEIPAEKIDFAAKVARERAQQKRSAQRRKKRPAREWRAKAPCAEGPAGLQQAQTVISGDAAAPG